MDWGKVGQAVADAAPLLGGVLLGPAGAVGGKLIAAALGTKEDPDAVAAAIQADPNALVKIKQIEADNALALQQVTLQAETARLATVNATIQTEVASTDPWVRRMRPTFGYVLAATLIIEVLIAAYVALIAPGGLPDLATLFNALAPPQGIGLAVLGVYFKKRSDEKMAGLPRGPGLLAGLFGR